VQPAGDAFEKSWHGEQVPRLYRERQGWEKVHSAKWKGRIGDRTKADRCDHREDKIGANDLEPPPIVKSDDVRVVRGMRVAGEERRGA
jgi:hypothetical protein